MPNGKVSRQLRRELDMAGQANPPSVSGHVHSELYSGPIPDPETLERYKNADPSFPERIMKMAEAHNTVDVAAKNRISLSNLIVPVIGQVFTLILGVAGILACIFLAQAGYTGPAVAAIAGSFAPMVIGAFRNLRRRD